MEAFLKEAYEKETAGCRLMEFITYNPQKGLIMRGLMHAREYQSGQNFTMAFFLTANGKAYVKDKLLRKALSKIAKYTDDLKDGISFMDIWYDLPTIF